MNNNLLHIDVERDLTEILKLIEEYMRRTYIRDIEREMIRCKERCKHKPTKEIELLTALATYVPVNNKETCEQLIRLFQYEQIANEMLPMLVQRDSRQSLKEEDVFHKVIVKLLLYGIMSKADKNR